ncbi:MAG: UDP-N-acetylmuramoyl-L-alanyl-D-glutamate--2,6-diaminopimelate ligase [FCB group bacterium]|nr:UDP-N-acetylmuramoyl-L-alanyl-D-glutamate--2,6-diaminopimelate ligase [FCB group bacterium]
MKKPLNRLVAGLTPSSKTLPAIEVLGVTSHTDDVRPGYLFIAIPGTRADGHNYIPTAIDRGAVAVITNGRDLGDLPVPQIKVANPRRAASLIAAEFFDHPSRKMTVIGVTGTNGKTTTASLIFSILKTAGLKTAQMGTLGLIAEDFPRQKTLTTMEPVALQETFHRLVRHGFTHLVMEVSSHALQQYRVADVDFNLAIYTNLTPEHLDYHHTMEEYFHAKAKLFKMLSITATAVVNVDDRYGEAIKSESTAPVVTTSIASEADVHFTRIDSTLDGIKGEIRAGEHRYQIESSLIGSFNLENILSGVAAAHILGLPPTAIETGIKACTVVPGRMEIITTPSGNKVIVDYAHTPDAYEKVLSTIRKLAPEGCQITVVFGAGGDRDASKRPLMAAIAESYATRCFVAPDNPRFEDPAQINAEVVKGFTRDCYTIFEDRGQALRKALNEMNPGDIVVVLGKGRENYQEIRGERIPYSDFEIIEEFCRAH